MAKDTQAIHGGTYGRMFEIPPCKDQPEAKRLGAWLHERSRSEESKINRKIPAGYTFLGQFVVHDLTFDPSEIDDIHLDPKATHNPRTVNLDLDSLYGNGPGGSPHLFDAEPGRYGMFRLGPTPTIQFDVPRDDNGHAVIADPRNDHNLILSQLHFAFLRFHNRVLERVHKCCLHLETDRERYQEARKIVTWHYQWIVHNEFLPVLCHSDVIAYLNGRDLPFPFYKVGSSRVPFTPVEFSAAALRVGHSQVAPSYRINRITSPLPIFGDGGDDLRGRRPITKNRQVDWRYFFPLSTEQEPRPQSSQCINTRIDMTLARIPPEFLPNSDSKSDVLAVRDLNRSSTWGLPCGDKVAEAIAGPSEAKDPKHDDGQEHPYPVRVIDSDDMWPPGSEFEGKRPPLWYYILREAELQERGERLGVVGSCLVAEVLIGILKWHPSKQLVGRVEPAQHGHHGEPFKWEPSYLSEGWSPADSPWVDPSRKNPREFTMSDLLRITSE